MNFLAHAWLASQHPAADAGLIAGGVAGDWIKGPLAGAGAGLPPRLARGVALHRAIDSFADAHPAFRTSRLRCAPEHRRWSGVLVDMFYDHLLARDWARWHPEALDVFVDRVHAALASSIDDLPADARPALRLMVEQGWLESYASLDGLDDVLHRMSRRARQPNPLAAGRSDFERAGEGLQADFADFMADATNFVARWRWPPATGD